MNGYYTLFKRDEKGIRGAMVPNYSKLTITLKWLKASKFAVTGMSAGPCPLEDGNQIMIYRNGKYFFGGIVEKIEIDCSQPESDIRTWKAEGRDLALMFDWRQIIADPLNITFEDETYDRIEDSAWNRIVHYIRNSYGDGTIWKRQLFPLHLPPLLDQGETALSAYKQKQLSEALEEIGGDNDLVPLLDQDEKTGEWYVTIADARDMTGKVFFAPNYGNVLKWKRSSSIPECNAVWVFSGDFSEGRLYVYAEDVESIQHYGRIEKIISRSDIAPWEPPEEEEEEPEEEEEEEEEEPRLSKEEVLEMLEQEAQSYLKEHGKKMTWSVEAAETKTMAFIDHWTIGDKVTCVLDGQRFDSQITQVKITYEKGIEKVEPTIGSTEEGLFGEIFRMIRDLDRRVTVAES